MINRIIKDGDYKGMGVGVIKFITFEQCIILVFVKRNVSTWKKRRFNIKCLKHFLKLDKFIYIYLYLKNQSKQQLIIRKQKMLQSNDISVIYICCA